MHQKLPVEIDPFKLAKSGLTLEGCLPLSGMSRISDLLQDNSGDVYVKARFGIDEISAKPVMRGRFKASLHLMCERCSELMVYEVDTESYLAIVSSEREVNELTDEYEAWLIDDNTPVSLSSMIEDELILSLPLIAKHSYACLPDEAWFSGEQQDDEKPVSPFAVLSSLKKD